jgi:hypothetical protein
MAKWKCEICTKHDVEYKDYRFIDSCSLQGRTYVCKWCYDLNDEAICDIVGDELDPKTFYQESEKGSDEI